jgi:hypothetical protein
MKRISSLFLILFLSATLFAQNSVWLEKGKETPLLVAEFKDAKDNVFNYLYVESELSNNITNSTYILASRDQKWWDKNIWVHGEIRTFVGKDFASDNIFLIGPMFGLLEGKYGFLNVQTMYRYDGKSNFQVSILSDVEYKSILYSMFLDTYGTDKFYAHTENRLFIKLFNPVRIGGNLVVTLNEVEKGIKLKPMAVIRVDL